MSNYKIAVIGGGGWGTALAMLISQKTPVALWCYETEIVDEIEMNRTNDDFLPGITIPDNITPVNDLSVIRDAEVIINTVPTQHIRSVYGKIDFSLEGKLIVNGTKGIEKGSLMRVSEVFRDTVGTNPDKYVSLSGPSHAEEVALNQPTGVVAASTNMEVAQRVRDMLSTDNFRVYSATDVVGCELGGAIKNVIAIAYGISLALGVGDNGRAALLTRGLAEMTRLGVACKADAQTFGGLSGLGDLVVTCTSKHSRNRAVGELLGKGIGMDAIHKSNKMIAEGVETTESAKQLAKKLGIEMPITELIYNIIYNGHSPKDCVNYLMSRENKNEVW
ncbi:MAG: NAD(P)-dependent glycerol-3-phosphate dehydrogenase [Ignavibacteria bacterium]|jgi:glycerol-3-phosphate dehydrogenase (NAD(P)+)|nr:NAD(P)-dependent glycerol-3-phosphate dehydrogenase [Ignavibacteria bacterium]